jgi:adenosylmethionine---8-amino-7-oxononanoate aminotransferase
MKTEPDPIHIHEAYENKLITKDGRTLIDGVSSWWSVIHGYNHPSLNKALTQQMNRLSHVMLGGLTHQPALDLADKLVSITPKSLTRVFFSDSGSVANEVALKMSIQYWRNCGNNNKRKLFSLKKAYHGDTTGVMALSDPEDSMHSLFSSILLKHLFLEAPLTGFDLSLDSLELSFKSIRKQFETHHESVAALIIEPILQGAGGMNIYSAHYLTYFRELCDEFDILLICDEVATGFGRTGTYFAIDHAGISPDILVLGKGLTGGVLGLAATIASETIFNSFLDDSWQKAFMHGPTFMGNPLACAVSLESIRLFEKTDCLSNIKQIETGLKKGLESIDSHCVKDCRIIGATGIIELKDSSNTDGFQQYAIDRGVWLRPFGPFIYTMPAYISSEEDISKITQVMRDWVYYKNKT